MIKQHKITETLTGIGANGKAEYEYHFANYTEKKNGKPKNEDVVPTKIKPTMKLTLTTANGKLEIEYADISTISAILNFLK